jgi:hypothetical protein
MVAPTSLASRPVSVRLRDPKLSSQLRDVMSTLLTRAPQRAQQSRPHNRGNAYMAKGEYDRAASLQSFPNSGVAANRRSHLP